MDKVPDRLEAYLRGQLGYTVPNAFADNFSKSFDKYTIRWFWKYEDKSGPWSSIAESDLLRNLLNQRDYAIYYDITWGGWLFS
uniref:Uncharacterized protein n=2 Tax=Ciona intestinalis TaxID=7719 RepID=F6V1H4_CIOIN